jgi:hypothetical protein
VSSNSVYRVPRTWRDTAVYWGAASTNVLTASATFVGVGVLAVGTIKIRSAATLVGVGVLSVGTVKVRAVAAFAGAGTLSATATIVVSKAQPGTGGPKPKRPRRYVYDVFRSGRLVKRPATRASIEGPPPAGAVRVVVEGHTEVAARKIARAAGRAKRDTSAHRNMEEQIIVAVLHVLGEFDV